jgi:tetratricopeptide (TPR) repeat protein
MTALPMVPALRDAFRQLFGRSFLRVLHLVVPPHTFGQTLAWLRAVAEHGPQPALLTVHAAPSFGPSRGWAARLRELPPEASGEVAEGPASDPLDTFAEGLARLAARTPQGLVVVLAPQHVASALEYARDVETLVTRRGLEAVRFVVLDAASSTLGDLTQRLAPRAATVPWIEANSQDWADIERTLAELRAPQGRLPGSLEERISAESPLRGPGFEDVRRALGRADGAQSPAEAAELLAEAAGLLLPRGLPREAAELGIERARRLFAAGQNDAGQKALEEAIRIADAHDVTAILPEALASMGSMEVRRSRFAEGQATYDRAASAAEKRGDRALAADFCRCAGHAALNAAKPAEGKRLWRRAFGLLDRTAPMTLSLEEPQELVVLAVSLADLFEETGNRAAAEALRGHATAIEQQTTRRPTTWD